MEPDRSEDTASKGRRSRIRVIERFECNQFITRTNERLNRVEDDLSRSACNRDFPVRINLAIIPGAKRCRDCLPQTRVPMGYGVLIEIRINCAFGRFLGEVWTGKVREPLPQVYCVMLHGEPTHLSEN